MMMALAAMTLTASAQTDPKVWPWDFPQDIEIDAKAGQQALTNQDHYFDYVERGEGFDKKTMIWYNTSIVEQGQGKTTVLAYGNKKEVPNALVIPLGKSETAKKGDILLIDPSQYILLTKGTARMGWSIHVQWLTDQQCFRMVFRCGGAPKQNAPITLANSSNTRSAFVTLAARA